MLYVTRQNTKGFEWFGGLCNKHIVVHELFHLPKASSIFQWFQTALAPQDDLIRWGSISKAPTLDICAIETLNPLERAPSGHLVVVPTPAQEHAQVLDRVGLKTIASMLVISVLLALRLDVAEAFPWPPPLGRSKIDDSLFPRCCLNSYWPTRAGKKRCMNVYDAVLIHAFDSPQKS